MPQRNTELKITQSPAFVWRYDSSFGVDDEGWCAIFTDESVRTGLEGNQENLGLFVDGFRSVWLGVPDLQGNDAYVTLNDSQNLYFTLEDLSNPNNQIEFAMRISRVSEARTTGGSRPYIAIRGVPTSKVITPNFPVPLQLPMGDGVVDETLLDAFSLTVVRGESPMTFNVWAEIDSETESIGIIALGTNTQAEATNEITCIVRYDPRIRASFKAELDGTTYLISRVEQIERYRFLRIGLSSFDASRA